MRLTTPLFGLALLLGSFLDEAPAQSGPGLPKLFFEQGEVFSILSTIGTGRDGMALMHDGYLAIVTTTDPNPFGRVRFFDLTNPYAPKLVKLLTTDMEYVSEAHTHAQTTAWGGKHVVLMRGQGANGGTGFAIWDWTDIFNPVRVSAFDLPGASGYTSGVFWLFVQGKYVYCPVGSLGLYIVDVSDPANPVIANHLPTSQTGGFNASVAYAVGNMLIVTNTSNFSGFARLDISDPIQPVLLHSQPNTPGLYVGQVNGNQMFIPDLAGKLTVHDIGPLSFSPVNSISIPTSGSSAVVQDGFVHVAASTAYLKIDVSNPANYTEVGSASSNIFGRDEDWATPLGNLVAVGDDSNVTGTHIIAHQSMPDNIGPAVTMVVPEDNAINQALTTRVGITMSDMILLESIDANTFFVRPAGGTPLAGSYSNQFGILNFAPNLPLLPNTTYEVVVPAGGLRDWTKNPVEVSFTSRFSTGAQVSAISVKAQLTPPVQIGTQVTFDVSSVSGPGPFQYAWNFGDGTPWTPFSNSSQATHTYGFVGHYSALVTVTNGSISGADSYIQTVHRPLTPNRPTRSSTIALDEPNQRAWCVNADNDTVTAIDTQILDKALEVPVGPHPRTLAVAPDGTIWVVCQDDATVRVLNPITGAMLKTIALDSGSEPYGIAMSPDGNSAYVSMRAAGKVARLDPVTGTLVGTIDVGPDPRGIAVSADSQRIFVTRFISSSKPVSLSDLVPAKPMGEIYELSAASNSLVRTLYLILDPGPDTPIGGRGLPNYMSSATISPDGRRLWVSSKKDNIERGVFRSEELLTFENSVRTISSQINLVTNQEVLSSRIDFNDSDMAFAVEFSSFGDYAFHALQGSNKVFVSDAYGKDLVAEIDGTGLAPQGLVLSQNDQRLYVHNFMSRTVSAYDAGGVTSSTNFSLPLLADVPTVAVEKLTPEVLRGKQIFYNASDPRMSRDGYISCASCHLDGGQDGRVWDFTERGEGLRNTITLQGRSGMGHGNVHWTANFDEIQDFENDIRGGFKGDGFLSNALFETTSNPLGPPKAGLSPELDALAAYVSSLSKFGTSPERLPSGVLSAEGQKGFALFKQLNCASCHSGQNFTDGLVHNVGTIGPGSGLGLGTRLQGFETPTLRGLWKTAPYLHDGSAATLFDVFRTSATEGQHAPVGSLTAQELSDLVLYLQQIDDLEPPAQ